MRIATLVAIGMVLLAPNAFAQSPVYFVTTANGDTTSVERFTRTGNTISGDWITKQGAVLHRYVLTLDANGLPARYELTLSRLGPSPAFHQSRFLITYDSDSATIVMSGDSTVTRRIAAKRPYPLLGSSAAGMSAAIEHLWGTHADSGTIRMVLPTQGAVIPPLAMTYRRLGGDSASVAGPGGGLIAKVDASGRLLDIHGGPQDIRRVRSLDIAHFTKLFIAADSADMAKVAARKEIVLTVEQLERFVGEYTIAQGRVLAITRDGNQVIGQLTGQPPLQMFAESSTKLFIKNGNAELEFEADSAGKFSALTVVQGATRQRATRATSLVQHPDFAGEWVMDSAKSQMSDPNLVALKLTASSRADTFLVVSDGTDAVNGAHVRFSTTTRAALDGRATENSMPGPVSRLTAVLKWEGATMVVVLSGDSNGNPVAITQRWSLDASGATLTRRQDLVVGGRTISEALVFAKRSPARH